jgi:two-component system sensor histidine kinase YcbA
MWMLITVVLASELKFYPFNTSYRISLGTAIFFFFLLWVRNIPPILSGFLVGTTVVVVRIALSAVITPFHLLPVLREHLPAFVFYFTFAVLFQLIRLNHFHQRPVIVGLLGVFVDTVTALIELTTRSFVDKQPALGFSIIEYLLIVAIIRSFFVVGFFHIIQLRQARIEKAAERKRSEHIIQLISNLYEETVQLEKSLSHSEQITHDCYELYQQLKEQPQLDPSLSSQALRIAGQVHDIKKDNQRIYAGLSKMISDESATDYLSIEELGDLVIKTHQKLARLLGKEIHFTIKINGYHPPYHIYNTLSLLNNLVSNAVEAIDKNGQVHIHVKKEHDFVLFQVTNDGPGIPSKHRALIFKAGFTTKYDSSGKPSTGIGLSYVKELVETMGGTVTFESEENETTFQIRLPVQSLMKGE